MSHRVRAGEPDKGWLGLARRSLALTSMVLALLAGGCIVADPPDSSDPEKTPPLLLLSQANPPVYEVKDLVKSSVPAQVPINVPVRSEDAGDKLYALLYKNWNLGGRRSDYIQASTVILAPSTFDDTGRMISTVWDYQDASRGCTQLTLMVTHASNFDLAIGYINPADIAIASWFFNIDDDGTNTLSSCGAVP
ncbi:MAG: hypothetical protein JW940_38105 [Polyangiaceae bacterium]|nr:hypothetical protein [Polyangiaceae bacterium]